jgi:hypothetical protein
VSDTTHTTHPAPTSQPTTEVIPTRNNYEHLVRAMNRETGANSKPASGAALSKTEFSRKPRYVVTHSEADKGKTVYYATCYENGKGYKGPLSPVIEAIVS